MVQITQIMPCHFPNFMSVASTIELNSKNNALHSTIMEETGGIGVDILVDNGGIVLPVVVVMRVLLKFD